MNQPESTSNALNVGRMVSFVVLLVIIGVMSVFFFKVMHTFFLPLFLAALTVVIFRPIHTWLLGKCNHRKRLAAALTTVAVLLVVLVPVSWAITLAIKEGAVLSTQKWDLAQGLEKLRNRFHLTMPYSDEMRRMQGLIFQVTQIDEDQDELTIRQPGEAEITALNTLADEIAEMAVVLVVPTSDTKPNAKEVQRISNARQDLGKMKEALDAALQSSGANFEVQPEAWHAYRNAINQLGVAFGTMRDDLAGGFPRSTLIVLANPSEEELEEWQTKAGDYMQKGLLTLTGKSTALVVNVLLGFAVMLISIYYFLIDGPDMIQAVMHLSPLDDRYETQLVAEFGQVSRAVVLATLLSAIVQGLLAGIGYYFAGLDALFLLTVLTAMIAMVPFVGAAAVWIPASLYLIFFEDGRLAAGIGLAIYGAVVVSMADNLIKPLVLHGQSNIHPLLALLSVLGGVQALGPIGILVGPMLVAFLQALLNMLRQELTTMSSKTAEVETGQGSVDLVENATTSS